MRFVDDNLGLILGSGIGLVVAIMGVIFYIAFFLED